MPVLHPYLVEGMKQPERQEAPKREEGRKAERAETWEDRGTKTGARDQNTTVHEGPGRGRDYKKGRRAEEAREGRAGQGKHRHPPQTKL